jgi:hypothetical protein
VETREGGQQQADPDDDQREKRFRPSEAPQSFLPCTRCP